MTALTGYFTLVATTTLTTANTISTTTGGSTTGASTSLAQATGYGEFISQGSAAAWPAAGSIGSPSGSGWLLDSTVLEGQQTSAGNWTPTLRGQISGGTGTIIGDIYVRVYKRSSTGTYTQIGTNMVLTGQTFQNATSTTYTFSAMSGPLTNFYIGDKLYVDLWVNVTTNATTGGSAIRFNEASIATGGAATMQIVTPGYLQQPPNGLGLVRGGHFGSGLVLGGVSS